MSHSPVRKRWQIVNGVILLDKPGGLSSNDALQKVRRLFSAAKAGHTGTLDPMATGLLPVCFGEATKFSSRLLEADKTYLATLRLGITTRTGDAEGEILRTREVAVTDAQVLAVCAGFVGAIEQIPPMYSALKYQGKALYEYARQGVEIERAARQVRIESLEVLRVEADSVDILVRCSKGTYVRTLAEDIGEQLGCGAHLTALRRTSTAGLLISDAFSLEEIAAVPEADRQAMLAPPDALLAHLPSVQLDSETKRLFLHGQTIKAPAPLGEVRVYGPEFLGLGVADIDGAIKPARLIAAPA